MSRSARVVRVEAEEKFGARLRGWIVGAEESFADVARRLGMSTNDLSDVFNSAKHLRAACLELLPAKVELAYIEERARAHQMRLAPATLGEATMLEVIGHIGQVLTLCGQSEADGFVDPDEAKRDLGALRVLQRKLDELVAHRERALRERGLAVVRSTAR